MVDYVLADDAASGVSVAPENSGIRITRPPGAKAEVGRCEFDCLPFDRPRDVPPPPLEHPDIPDGPATRTVGVFICTGWFVGRGLDFQLGERIAVVVGVEAEQLPGFSHVIGQRRHRLNNPFVRPGDGDFPCVEMEPVG